MEFTVRDYHPEDFNTLWEIDQACFPLGVAYSRYELRIYIRRPGASTLVAESLHADPNTPGKQILGFIVAERSRRGAGRIITIDVRTSARRHRVGSTLLEAAEARLRSANCRSVRLETAVDNTPAIAFYKRHGYHLIQTIPHYYSNGVDALLLERDLLSGVSSS